MLLQPACCRFDGSREGLASPACCTAIGLEGSWVGRCDPFALSGRDDEARRIGASEPKDLGELQGEKGLSVEELAEQSGVDVALSALFSGATGTKSPRALW